jgi:formylmethanofuran dehydrogenase subunit D
MLLVECWLDVHNNGTIVVDKEASPHLSVEEGDEYVVFIRNGQVIFAKKSALPNES